MITPDQETYEFMWRRERDARMTLEMKVEKMKEAIQGLQPDEENRKAYVLAIKGQKAQIKHLKAEVTECKTEIRLLRERQSK